MIALVALIVIGPERLPKVARTAGHLLGRLQRYVNTVKTDISREMALEDLKNLQQQVQDSARDLERSVSDQMRTVEEQLRVDLPGPIASEAEGGPAAAADTSVQSGSAPTLPKAG